MRAIKTFLHNCKPLNSKWRIGNQREGHIKKIGGKLLLTVPPEGVKLFYLLLRVKPENA